MLGDEGREKSIDAAPPYFGNDSGNPIVDLRVVDEAYKTNPNRRRRCQAVMHLAIKKAGLTQGRMLEIGGRRNPLSEFFPTFDYAAMDIDHNVPGGVPVLVGDITRCPEISDASFELIVSIDVFEHVDKPWLAAREIMRMLKPGGVTIHSTLFAWRYHPCPIDYWRYTPAALKSLFDGMVHLHASFDYAERRRNVIGAGTNRLEPDALGGWRENVRVHYAGMKPKG